MKKIVLTIGISGSGKSTFAHEQWKANPTGVVVVNRDSIRNLLFGFTDQTIQEYYTRPDLNKIEKQVTKYEDTQIKSVVNSLQTQVFICTGRDGICLDETIKWLDSNNIHYDKVFIRKAGDMRPDWQIKAEIWQQISENYYIDFLIDDRMQVVRHARALGLKVLQVDYNNF